VQQGFGVATGLLFALEHQIQRRLVGFGMLEMTGHRLVQAVSK
jgi:hypothetical protein